MQILKYLSVFIIGIVIGYVPSILDELNEREARETRLERIDNMHKSAREAIESKLNSSIKVASQIRTTNEQMIYVFWDKDICLEADLLADTLWGNEVTINSIKVADTYKDRCKSENL